VSVDTEANDDESEEGASGKSSGVSAGDADDDDDDGDGGNDEGTDDEGGDDNDSMDTASGCDADALEAAVIAFCEVQATGEHTPAAGETGSPCSSGETCNGVCVDDYPYDGSGYCGDRSSAVAP
jgi:hypothetical protein